MQFLNVVALHHPRTLLSTSFDSTARVTYVGSPKSNGMLHLSIIDLLFFFSQPFLASPILKNGWLFTDRNKYMAHPTSYHSCSFSVLLYAAQRRHFGNVAALR